MTTRDPSNPSAVDDRYGFNADPGAVDRAQSIFRSSFYLRHNARRTEHLVSLGLDLHGRSVLEVGAGVGDHTTFFLDRGCRVTSLEPRPENCAGFAQNMLFLKSFRYEASNRCTLVQASIEDLDRAVDEQFDIVYCYGLLYHVADPMMAIALMARRCKDMLLLETAVTPGDSAEIHPEPELGDAATQAVGGIGCRPTRRWIVTALKAHFAHAYVTTTQPWHEEFPTDWSISKPPAPSGIARAVFVASRAPLALPTLSEDIPMRQARCP